MAWLVHSLSDEEVRRNKKGMQMLLMHVFEVLLLVAIVAGIFVGWKEPAKYRSQRIEPSSTEHQPVHQ